MATRAYVLIETTLGKTRDVLSLLQQVRGIREADAVTGEYDIIAVLEAEDLEGISELVTGSIHAIGGIHRTKTYVRAMDN